MPLLKTQQLYKATGNNLEENKCGTLPSLAHPQT
jgi:hypothetical protein